MTKLENIISVVVLGVLIVASFLATTVLILTAYIAISGTDSSKVTCTTEATIIIGKIIIPARINCTPKK